MSAAREAICAAAGWEYCPEHDKPRYDGPTPCAHLHRVVEVKHDQACSWPNDDCICGAFGAESVSSRAAKEPE